MTGMVLALAFMLGFAFLATFVFKIEGIERALGNLDTFWAERKWLAWTPRRRPPLKPNRRGRKHRKPSIKEQAEDATDAAIKAARWPYE